jgi:hypothetical protein
MTKRIRAWEQRSRKRSTRNSDGHDLDDISQHLTQLGFNVIREPTITNHNFVTKNKIRMPDLKITKDKFECLLELDGKVHGEIDMPTKKTLDRNGDYETTHKNYVVVNKEAGKFCKIDLLDHATLLVLHEYLKHKSRLHIGAMFV